MLINSQQNSTPNFNSLKIRLNKNDKIFVKKYIPEIKEMAKNCDITLNSWTSPKNKKYILIETSKRPTSLFARIFNPLKRLILSGENFRFYPLEKENNLNFIDNIKCCIKKTIHNN